MGTPEGRMKLEGYEERVKTALADRIAEEDEKSHVENDKGDEPVGDVVGGVSRLENHINKRPTALEDALENEALDI